MSKDTEIKTVTITIKARTYYQMIKALHALTLDAVCFRESITGPGGYLSDDETSDYRIRADFDSFPDE